MNLESSWLVSVPRSLLRIALACAMCAPALNAIADSNSLRERYGELRQQLASNNFHRPLLIDSAQAGDVLRGDVYAVLDYRFDEVSSALKDPADWCDILILPFNTRAAGPSCT